MKLALRIGPAQGADAMESLAAKVIEERLVTGYPHAGMLIDGLLYHSTARDGLKREPLPGDNWTLIDVGSERDSQAIKLFFRLAPVGYDWFSLLAFAGLKASDSRRLYCYEWCHLAMTGQKPRGRVTVESLLLTGLRMRHPESIVDVMALATI